jgi:hypothetical protein
VTAESDARRIAAGPSPSELVKVERSGASPTPSEPDQPYDPLQLCIYATIALLGWAAGPVALLVFAAVGFVGYWRARRAGLLRSKCFLRDTRLVLAYLAVLAAAGVWGTVSLVTLLLQA